MKRTALLLALIFYVSILPPLYGVEIKGNFSDIVTKGPWVDVRAYGAVDNVDSTSAIVAAIASLPAGRTTKGKVLIKGDFLISSPITVPNYTIIEIHGRLKVPDGIAAPAAVFRIGDSDTNPWTPGKHIEIRGGELDGNRTGVASGYARGIYVYPGEDVIIDGMHIHDFGEEGIRVMGLSNRIKVTNSVVGNNGSGNIIFKASTVSPQPYIDNSTMIGNVTYNSTAAAGSADYETMNARNITVTSNVAHGGGVMGIGFHIEEHLYNSTFTGNVSYNHTSHGFRGGYSYGNVLSGNTSYENDGDGFSFAGGFEANTLTGNSAHTNGRSGFMLEDNKNNVVSGNVAWNNGQAAHGTYNSGFQLNKSGTTGPTNNLVAGNIAFDNQAVKTQEYGVAETNTGADNNVIVNNLVRGNKTGGISRGLWGINSTIVRDNIGQQGYHTFTVNDNTPSVALGVGLYKTANTDNTTKITTFLNPEEGRPFKVLAGDNVTTFDFSGGGNLVGNAGVDFVALINDLLTCVYDGTNIYCEITDNNP